jgi:hypothetical protein
MPSVRKRHAVQLFRGLPARYDRVGAVMSFGQDPRWRDALVDFIDPRSGMRILDVATGTGMVAFALAARGAEVVGLDQSEAMLGRARTAEPASTIDAILNEADRVDANVCWEASPTASRSTPIGPSWSSRRRTSPAPDTNIAAGTKTPRRPLPRPPNRRVCAVDTSPLSSVEESARGAERCNYQRFC